MKFELLDYLCESYPVESTNINPINCNSLGQLE